MLFWQDVPVCYFAENASVGLLTGVFSKQLFTEIVQSWFPRLFLAFFVGGLFLELPCRILSAHCSAEVFCRALFWTATSFALIRWVFSVNHLAELRFVFLWQKLFPCTLLQGLFPCITSREINPCGIVWLLWCASTLFCINFSHAEFLGEHFSRALFADAAPVRYFAGASTCATFGRSLFCALFRRGYILCHFVLVLLPTALLLHSLPWANLLGSFYALFRFLL